MKTFITSGNGRSSIGNSIAVVLAAAATLGAWSSEALGDEPPPPYQVGLAAGVRVFSGASGLGRYANDSSDNAPPLFSPFVTARVLRWLVGPWAIEGEGGLIPTQTRDQDASLWIATAGIRGIYRLAPRRGLIPFATAGLSLAAARSSDTLVVENDVDGSLHASVGLFKPLGSEVMLRVEARVYWSPAFGTIRDPAREDVAVPPEPELSVGISLPFGQWPPPPPRDADGDHLLDAEDACPRHVGPRENAGCPEVDSDGDRVVDRIDVCPAEAEDIDGFADTDGCDDSDDDRDRIADADDRCPRQPETANGFEDDDGCPDDVPPPVKTFTGTIKGIHFHEDSAVITAGSFETLDRAARVLGEYPAIHVEISGHTDSTGTREHNLELSVARAEAVKTYLASKGIQVGRLRSVGVGPDRPVSGNDTEEGKARNRRIEFRLLSAGE